MESTACNPDFGTPRVRLARLRALAGRYRDDPRLRARIAAGEVSGVVAQLGLILPHEVEARIAVNTAETYHVVLPPDPNAVLSDEALYLVGGGASASTAGTIGTTGTFACSCVASSLGSLGTAGSAGCAA